MNNCFNNEPYTSLNLAEELFGQCEKKIIRKELSYKEAVEITKNLQKHDPNCPCKYFMKILQKKIADWLKISEKRISIFTAVGSPLQRYMVSGFVVVDDEFIVTMTAAVKIHICPNKYVDVIIDGGAEIPITISAREISLILRKKGVPCPPKKRRKINYPCKQG